MTVELRTNRQKLSGFARGNVTLTMESVYNVFDVEYVASGKQPGERAIYKGDECELAIDGETLLGGWADSTTETDEPDRLELRSVGRSKTCDIDDCSAPILSFQNATLLAIAQKLVKRLGKGDLKVHIVGDAGPKFESFHVQRGETALDAIQRACSRRGFYPYCVGADLVLARVGSTTTRTVLERGKNVRRSTREDSLINRYSEYVFRGQVPGTDKQWGTKANQLKHAITDPGVTRYRPLVLDVDTHGPGDLKTKAEVERNQRAGRSESIVCLVDGHKTVEGYCWRPNLLVPYKNPVLGVDATLLVVTARMRFGENEDDDTELVLTRPESFDLVNYPAQGRGLRWT